MEYKIKDLQKYTDLVHVCLYLSYFLLCIGISHMLCTFLPETFSFLPPLDKRILIIVIIVFIILPFGFILFISRTSAEFVRKLKIKPDSLSIKTPLSLFLLKGPNKYHYNKEDIAYGVTKKEILLAYRPGNVLTKTFVIFKERNNWENIVKALEQEGYRRE